MADEVELEPEFEDEDDFTTRLDELSRKKPQSNTPDTTAPEGAPPVEEAAVPPTTPRFTPKRQARENKKLLEQAQREAERKRKTDQTEARRVLREQQQDQAREQRIQSREALRISREQVTSARSDAIAGRVQSYSLAASIGFPGYVAASVVDAMYIRPKEEASVQAEKQYQLDLQRYNEQVRKDQIDEKRRQEQAIRDMPIDAVQIDERGKPVKNPPLPPIPPGMTPPSNVPPPGGLPPNSPLPPTGGQPPGQPPQGPPPGATPPPIPPTRPNPVAPMGNIAQAAVPLTAAIQTAQYINQAIDKLADSVDTVAVSVAKGDGTEASKATVKTFQSAIDPLGVQIPLNVAVQGFETLIDVNKAILDTTRQNLAFAPQSLQADISGDLQKLIQSIEISRRIDPTTAELIKANAQFDMAWQEARAQLIENLGPAVIKLLELITLLLRTQTTVIDAGSGFTQGFMNSFAPVLTAILSRIASNTDKDLDALDDSDILNQIGTFFNAGDQKTKMRMNNTFPNP